MNCTGEFETHITIATSDPEKLNALAHWATPRGLKFLHIQLERGATPSQPMLTKRGRGTFAEQLTRANETVKSLTLAGFPVARVKLEIDADHPFTPRSKEAAARADPSQYFEHHIKLLLNADFAAAELHALALRHGAHLSRNALRRRDDGFHERFVTQRCAGVIRAEAQRRLDALLAKLVAHQFQVLEIEAEYTVYDSNLAVDAGWLNAME